MGHSRSEMCCNECGRMRCDCYKKDHPKLIEEIEDIIKKNPIKIGDVKPGCQLRFYKGLFVKSKINSNNVISNLWIVNEKLDTAFIHIFDKKNIKWEIDDKYKQVVLGSNNAFFRIYVDVQYLEII